MLTLQEIFQKVRSHLLAQGERSMIGWERSYGLDSICAYRGNGGRKCAVGVLIEDEYYSPHLEGHPIHDEEVREALISSGIDVSKEDVMGLVAVLQTCHDNVPPHSWEDHLDLICRRFVS